MRQNVKRRKRNYTTRSEVKTKTTKVLDLVKAKDQANAEVTLKEAYKTIDTAAKKNIIHKNTAARKKSLLARNVNTLKK